MFGHKTEYLISKEDDMQNDDFFLEKSNPKSMILLNLDQFEKISNSMKEETEL